MLRGCIEDIKPTSKLWVWVLYIFSVGDEVMELMTRELKCDAMYKMILGWRTLKEIVDLMIEYRPAEKKNLKLNDIDRLIYVVFADCLGDVLDTESFDGFFNSNIPNFLFIDQYSDTSHKVLIAHELIHYLQQYLYSYPNDNHYEDWTEIMARGLQYKVRDIIYNYESKNMIFKHVTNNSSRIDDFIEYKRDLIQHDPIQNKLYGFEGNVEDCCRVELYT